MGSDFEYIKIKLGQESTPKRSIVLETIVNYLQSRSYSKCSEFEAYRSLVVGPPDIWLHLGDSSSGEEKEELKLALSSQWPIVSVEVSDTAIIHISLYTNGKKLDCFGNGKMPFYKFKDPNEGKEYRGKFDLWEKELKIENLSSYLINAWNQENSCDEIIQETSEIFDWDLRLSYTGYSHDDEGIFIKYSKYLEGSYDISLFSELHFTK